MKSPVRQRGMTTVLIVMIVSLAMGAAALMIILGVRGNQERQAMVHATTHSQAGAWAGVELYRRYFEQLSVDEAQLTTAADPIRATLDGNALSATIVDVAAPDGGDASRTYTITVDIRSEQRAARSTAVIRAVYLVSSGSAGSGTTDSGGADSRTGDALIDLRDLPASSDPDLIPDMDESSCEIECEEGGGAAATKLKWARYL
ncbi:hypothetical protein D9M69_194650 [compost metagenome]